MRIRNPFERLSDWQENYIECPYCGKEITRDEYDINEKGKYVKIHCADNSSISFSVST